MTDEPGYTPDKLVRTLSLPRRIGHALVGLAGLTAAATITQLWATEPTPLPARTQIAFATLITIGLAWTAFATYTLIRRPLFALDRVIAATLALTFTTLLTTGTTLLALTRANPTAALISATTGLTLITTATLMLLRARTYRTALLTRKHDLEGRG
ncbi:transmembrane transport protein [Umezawaea tangerina]|uniref:Transmembrane protein n=1 Tax=Umezawaea tangerina TaxID=84725 RepID=A0A2T0T7V3_9PSEU|nr:transmembrane transport protein [Umezawaea tangerina]PRY41718.1 hypothetical protein CLV43_105477 [Umezawaea tangerina]